jgi:hypothetical protein
MYQNKRLTKFAFRKPLILKGAVLVVLGTHKTWNSVCLEEKREQAPALQTQLPTE